MHHNTPFVDQDRSFFKVEVDTTKSPESPGRVVLIVHERAGSAASVTLLTAADVIELQDRLAAAVAHTTLLPYTNGEKPNHVL
jgi:hypothetical protein